MIKLFASDLDGTLLNATHMVDPVIVSALRTVTKSGAHFAVATGRTMRSPNDFGFHGVGIEAVCSNGSIILDRDGNTIYHSDVDKGVLEEMLRTFPQVCFECVGLDRTYVTGSPQDQLAG
ncbi:HAD family hydrolase, partial [Collinsella tanakaei]